jgi:heptose I phosphotransferase
LTRREAVAPPWRARLAAAGLPSLGALLAQRPDAQQLRGRWEALTKPGLGGRERWRWELDDAGVPAVVFVKRYTQTPLGVQLDRIRRQTATRSRAWWEYRQSERLTAAHVPVPEPVGFVEEMRGTFERRSAVLLARVAGDAIERIWQRACEREAPVTRELARHDLTVRLGRFIAAFHGTGYCHRDLYLCHVFVDLDPEARRPPEFCLIDLARTFRPRWRRMRWIIKDLSQLDVSARRIGAARTDRLRFLLAYLGLQPRAPRVRWYARRIVRKSDRILRRIERKSQTVGLDAAY